MTTLSHEPVHVDEAFYAILFTAEPVAPKPRELRKHRSCGLTGPGFRHCQRCDMVDAYHERRAQYLDELEQCGRGDEKPTPVTFKWWLQTYEWPSHHQEAA